MKLDRFRAPALAATAVLLISGAASAFAAAPVTSTPAAAAVAPAAEAPEAAGPDTDTLQEGDQTMPDVAGAAEAPESAAEAAEAPEAAGTEADGPGGHADADGQNVDHQFDGEE